MNKSEHDKTFAQCLLQQDPMVTESQFKEYRMKLEQQITVATRNEKRVRVAMLIAWGVATLLPLAIVIVERCRRGMGPIPPLHIPLPLEAAPMPGLLGRVAAILYTVSAACAWVLLLIYFFKHRDTSRRARDEFQIALLGDLARQIAEIRRQLPPAAQ